MDLERSNDKSQHLIQPQNTYQRFFKSALDYAAKVYDTVTVPQIPREGTGSTEETSPSSPTLPIPGAYPPVPNCSGRFSTAPASEFPARATQNLDETNVTDNQAGGVVAVPGQPRHAYDNPGASAAEDRGVSCDQWPDIGDPSEQETTHLSTQDVTSQLHGAHHFTIGGNPQFENIGVKNEYNYGNRGGTYGIEILEEFVSFKALHDSYAQDPTRRVHPGTRQYVLRRIRDWFDIPSAKERIFWLRGPAGVGKSAIAQTIARSCALEKLAATFFFYRSDPGRNDGNRLFTTLAWQIAFSIPATKNALIHSLNERPDIAMKDVETQFEGLIVKTFLTLKRSGVQVSAPVVIIDGVDECSDDDLQQRFLKIIGNAVRDDRVPLRFLICSRLEAHIQDAMNIFRSITLPFDLAKLNDANQDIEKYFKTEFSRIATEQDLDPAWPGEQIIQKFVYKASGQFVYATTVVKYVDDKYNSAETQLHIILGLKPPSTISPFAGLDALYMEILRRQRDPVFLRGFLSLLIGRDGINVDDLHEDDAMLMNVPKKELDRKLRGMQSLLKLEPYIDAHHQSFLDFLQDVSRSGQYHISKQAGTRRYLDFIAGSLVRYASAVIERHDNHKTHFRPQFHSLVRRYPANIVLPIEEWQEALEPLLNLWNKLLSLPNFRSTWELLPCKECTGFHTMRNLLLHLAFRFEASDPDPNSVLAAEFRSDGPEGMINLTPSIQTGIEANMHEKDLNAFLSPLLPRLRMRKLGMSLDMDTVQLTCSLLRFSPAETTMRLRSISDAQNLVDLIDELINNKDYFSDYGPDISCKSVYLALEIYARVPILPRSLFSKGTVGLHEYVTTVYRETELLSQTVFMSKILDPNYIVRLSGVCEEESGFFFVIDNEDESKESLSQWRKRSKPSSVTRIRTMLEVAKAIRYFHSMGIILHDAINSKYIFLDSEFHARFQRFLALTAHYVKVTPISALGQKWLSYEANVFFFGCLFYEMCFDSEISHYDRIHNRRNTVAKRPSEPEIFDDEWQLIQRCCAEDPKGRPTMDDIVREMEAWDINP